MSEQLELLTKQLLGFVEQGKEQFERAKNSGQAGDFFLEVKPFADKVKNTCEEWIVLAKHWVEKEKPQYLNQKQLDTTYEHLENIAIQSFYPSTSRKRFLSSIQSVEYVLHSVLENSSKTTT